MRAGKLKVDRVLKESQYWVIMGKFSFPILSSALRDNEITEGAFPFFRRYSIVREKYISMICRICDGGFRKGCIL